jgi:NAD(P)H-hydrate epimerase
MQKVLTAEEMREVDRLTTEKYGIPSILLMENAAHAAARIITEKLGGSVKGKKFLILCGKGNNGGDGAALARILALQGADINVVLLGKIEELKSDALINFEIVKNITIANLQENRQTVGTWYGVNSCGTISLNYCLGPNEWIEDELLNKIFSQADVIVDSILGTGVTRKLEGIYLQVAQAIKWKKGDRLTNLKPLIVSLDLPSGLNADLGIPIGINVESDLTVTFTSPKTANVVAPASSFGGELAIVDIGSPMELIDNSPSQLYLAAKQDAENWINRTRFTTDSYKNRRGHALLIAGSRRFTGAAVLCADACLRTGVGLVTLATPKSVQGAISARVLPEVMTVCVSETEKGAIAETAWAELKDLVQKSHVVAIGSGLSSEDETTRKFVREAVEHRKTPVLLDADGLNALSPFDLQGSERFPLILTPHKGEMRRLLGLKDQDDLGDSVALVREFAQKHQVILVLKGERALIAEPGGKVVINPTGNSGLGKGGNGDTLAGIITGFLTQAVSLKADIFETVVAAVYIAGLAGDLAAEKFGKRAMSASDVRECLVESFRQLEQ